jgi:hypothetical protein
VYKSAGNNYYSRKNGISLLGNVSSMIMAAQLKFYVEDNVPSKEKCLLVKNV